MFKVTDQAAALAFVDLLVGFTPVGVANDEEINRPTSPEVRSHLAAALGGDLPTCSWQMMHTLYPTTPGPLASYLRSVADAIDPIPATN